MCSVMVLISNDLCQHPFIRLLTKVVDHLLGIIVSARGGVTPFTNVSPEYRLALEKEIPLLL